MANKMAAVKHIVIVERHPTMSGAVRKRVALAAGVVISLRKAIHVNCNRVYLFCTITFFRFARVDFCHREGYNML